MDKIIYNSAMQKVSPSNKWKNDTLLKMQAELNKNQTANLHVLNKAGNTKKAFKLSNSNKTLIAAAAIALIALPALYITLFAPPIFTMGSDAAAPEAAYEHAIEEAYETAPTTEEAMPFDEPVADLPQVQNNTEDASSGNSEYSLHQDDIIESEQDTAQGALLDTIIYGIVLEITETHISILTTDNENVLCHITPQTVFGSGKDIVNKNISASITKNEDGTYILLEINVSEP